MIRHISVAPSAYVTKHTLMQSHLMLDDVTIMRCGGTTLPYSRSLAGVFPCVKCIG